MFIPCDGVGSGRCIALASKSDARSVLDQTPPSLIEPEQTNKLLFLMWSWGYFNIVKGLDTNHIDLCQSK